MLNCTMLDRIKNVWFLPLALSLSLSLSLARDLRTRWQTRPFGLSAGSKFRTKSNHRYTMLYCSILYYFVIVVHITLYHINGSLVYTIFMLCYVMFNPQRITKSGGFTQAHS